MSATALLLVFLAGLAIGRITRPRRPRGLVDGPGLAIDRATRRPELRARFEHEHRRIS